MTREESLAALAAARTDYCVLDEMAAAVPTAKITRLRRVSYARWLLAVRTFRTLNPELDSRAEVANG